MWRLVLLSYFTAVHQLSTAAMLPYVMCTVLLLQVAPGMLITFLQKGLAYVGIEEHLNEVSCWRGLSHPNNKIQ